MPEDAHEVLKTLVFKEKQIASQDGRWFTMRMMPYRTHNNMIDGLVITFADITGTKTLEAELHRLQAELQKRFDDQTIKLEETGEMLQAEISSRKKLEKDAGKVPGPGKIPDGTNEMKP